MIVVLFAYTGIVGIRHGWNLFAIFFGDIAAMTWPGQFNLDFTCLLMFTGLWLAWRHHFSPAGLALGPARYRGRHVRARAVSPLGELPRGRRHESVAPRQGESGPVGTGNPERRRCQGTPSSDPSATGPGSEAATVDSAYRPDLGRSRLSDLSPDRCGTSRWSEPSRGHRRLPTPHALESRTCGWTTDGLRRTTTRNRPRRAGGKDPPAHARWHGCG